MTNGRPVIWGLAAGAALYLSLFGLEHFVFSGPTEKSYGDVVQVTPTTSPSEVVTRSAKIGDKLGAKRLAPVVTQNGTSSVLVTPVLSPVPSPSVTLSPTPVPYTTIVPSATPYPSNTPIPSPSVSPAPIIIPSSTPIPSQTPVAQAKKIVINEIAWMGTESSATDEWIELYNLGDESVDLTGWKLLIAGDKAISLSGRIAPHGFYLLERTDDSAISDVAADYSGPFGSYGLSNSGEHLTLVSDSGEPTDDVDCSAGWFAGVEAKGAKSSMERIDPSSSGGSPSSWASNNGKVTIGHDAGGLPILGTPRAANSSTI